MKGQCGIEGAGDDGAVHCEQPLQPAQPHRTSHSCVLKGQCWRHGAAATCVARIRRGARAQRAIYVTVRRHQDSVASGNLSDYLRLTHYLGAGRPAPSRNYFCATMWVSIYPSHNTGGHGRETNWRAQPSLVGREREGSKGVDAGLTQIEGRDPPRHRRSRASPLRRVYDRGSCACTRLCPE